MHYGLKCEGCKFSAHIGFKKVKERIMPEISIRGLEMPESSTRKLSSLAVAEQNRGLPVYQLNIGQPDLPPLQCGLDTVKNINRTLVRYSPSQGILAYREKPCGYYKKFSIDVEPENIIITTGGSEAVPFPFMS